MDLLLINFFGVLITLLIERSMAEEPVRIHLNGSYKFLPYERLTDEKFIEKRGEIAKATELKIERFAIPSIELLMQYLDNNTSIKNLYLNDVTFDSRLPEKDSGKKRIYLPRIKKYEIFVRDVELEDESEKNFQTLQRFLLVEKRWNKYYSFTVQLGSQIYVEYEFYVHFGYSRCNFRYFHPSSLPSNDFNCKYIKIFKQSIDLVTLPTNLKELKLTDVEIYKTSINGTRENHKLINLNGILKYFPELSDLEIKYSNPPKYQIIFDLAYSIRNLIYLSLSHCKVVNTKNYEKEHKVGFGVFECEHCEFEIRNYTNLVISIRGIVLRNNDYKTPKGFQRFISSLRYVWSLSVDEMYDFNLDWVHNGTAGRLRFISLANLNYQKPKLELSFPKGWFLTLVNINVVELESSLSSAFPNLARVRTTDTNPDLIRILSANEKLRWIYICFPERNLNGVNNTLGREPRDFTYIAYEKKSDSWIIDKDNSKSGTPYKSQQYIQYYIWTIFIISSIGLIGNLLIMIVYSRQSVRNSTSYIILSLAIYDSLLLILTQLSLTYFQIKLTMDGTDLIYKKWWAEKTEGSYKKLFANPRGFTVLWYNLELSDSYLNWLFNIQSKWIYPMSKAAYFGSIYTTVLLTLERYFAICFPFRVKDYFNSKSVWVYFIIFGILSIILFAVKGFESFYSNEFFEHFYGLCGPVYAWERTSSSKNPLNYRAYRLLFQEIFWNALMYVVPITLLLGLNYLIWREIRRSAALRARSHASQDQAATLQITTMLVCVSLVFVICNSISGSIVWYQLEKGADHLADVEIYSCLPLVINSSVNFVIYSLLGKKFREEFRKLLDQFWEMVKNLKQCGVCCETFVGMWLRRVHHPQQSQSTGRNITAENYELTLQHGQ